MKELVTQNSSEMPLSKFGYPFTVNNDHWRLSRDSTVNMAWMATCLSAPLHASAHKGMQLCLTKYSGAHRANVADNFQFFAQHTFSQKGSSQVSTVWT